MDWVNRAKKPEISIADIYEANNMQALDVNKIHANKVKYSNTGSANANGVKYLNTGIANIKKD